MGFAINTNNDAINTYKNLTSVQNSLSKSLEKLSSGLRINQAGDDAAGLTISTQLGAQVSGLQQASRNAQDGTSLVQTADGALTQAQSILGRLRDLAVQAGNDSNSAAARGAIQSEATSLTDELSRLGKSVNFNGQNLLDGTTPTFKFQVGADGNAASQISVDLSKSNLVKIASQLSTGSATLKVAETTNADGTLLAADITKLNGALTFTSGAAGNTSSVTLASGTFAFSSTSTVGDAVSALNANSAFSSRFKASVLTDASTGNQSIGVESSDGLTATALSGSTAYGATATASALQFNSATNAQASIKLLDTQIAAVSAARANIGAIENRFTNVVSTIATSVTNLTAAKSRITDVDMAQEMVNYTRANVLSQSGTAMLAQANSLPQLALKLLG
jgi:flagellin